MNSKLDLSRFCERCERCNSATFRTNFHFKTFKINEVLKTQRFTHVLQLFFPGKVRMIRPVSRDSEDSIVSLPSIPYSSDDRRSQDYYSNTRFVRVGHKYGEDLAFEQCRSHSLDQPQSRYSAAVNRGTTMTMPEKSIYQGLKTRFRALVRKIKVFRGHGSND